MMSAEKFGRHTTEVQERVEKGEMLVALRNKVESEKHLEICRGLSEGTGLGK